MPPLESVEAYHDAERKLAEIAPRFGPGSFYSDMYCLHWPDSRSLLPEEIDAEGSRPILVIGVTGDVATPYVSSKALAGRLDNAVLLTLEGNLHTAAFANRSVCVDEAVTVYLLDLELPRTGTRCELDR